jgi:hypothetical protein
VSQSTSLLHVLGQEAEQTPRLGVTLTSGAESAPPPSTVDAGASVLPSPLPPSLLLSLLEVSISASFDADTSSALSAPPPPLPLPPSSTMTCSPNSVLPPQQIATSGSKVTHPSQRPMNPYPSNCPSNQGTGRTATSLTRPDRKDRFERVDIYDRLPARELASQVS